MSELLTLEKMKFGFAWQIYHSRYCLICLHKAIKSVFHFDLHFKKIISALLHMTEHKLYNQPKTICKLSLIVM